MSEELPKIEPVERRLDITPQTAALLRRAQGAMLDAERNFQLLAAATLASHGLENAQLVRLEDGVLVVRLTTPQ